MGENIMEHTAIEHILKKYDINVKSIDQCGQTYIIDSDTGLYRVESTKYNKESVKRDYNITDYLVKEGFDNVIKYKRTLDGRLFVKEKGIYFYMKEHIETRECDISDFNEVIGSITLLANFHSKVNGEDSSKYRFKYKKDRYLPYRYSKWCRKLLKFQRLIQNKKTMTEFDKKYYDNIKGYYLQGIMALNLLNQSNYDDVLKRAKSEKHICHGNYYYHNVLLSKSQEYYMTGFDHMAIDLRMQDLGKFIRKLMPQKDYMWDFEKCREIIKSYSSIINISKEELKILLSTIIFPYSFCRLGKAIYEKHRSIFDPKYIKKLSKEIDCIECRQKFIDYFSECYDLSIKSNA